MNNICRYQKITQLSTVCRPHVSSISTQNYCTRNVSKEDLTNTAKQSADDTKDEFRTFQEIAEKYKIPEKATTGFIPSSKRFTFTALLRYSGFIDLGDPQGKIVMGTIFQVVDDDLYIDFGWKFHCVCTRPQMDSTKYIRGAQVKLRIKDLELSTRFLGATMDLTLMEADCSLIGLVDFTPKTD